MNASTTTQPQGLDYELRFQSVLNEGRGYAFPCDVGGHVDMDSLSYRSLNNYLYARTVVGLKFSRPAVLPCTAH